MSILPPRPPTKTPKQKMKPFHWAPLPPMNVRLAVPFSLIFSLLSGCQVVLDGLNKIG